MNRYRFEEIYEGLTESFQVTVTQDMLDTFYKMTGDGNPMHRDVEYARKRGYNGQIVYGMLTASFISTLAGEYLPGEHSLIHRVELEFPAPVYPGDKLEVSGTVTEILSRFRTIILKVTIRNQDQKKVCRGKLQVGFSD